MGLDMYLTKRTYVKQWDHIAPENQYHVTVTRGGQPVSYIRPERVAYVEEQVGYWRKANHIHAWFVANVQGGVDEGQESDVSPAQLRELLTVCLDVLNCPKLGPTLLPTQSGFFFGDTSYSEGYLSDIRDTVKILREVLNEDGPGDLYYRASW